MPSARRSYHSISFSNMLINEVSRTLLACISPKTSHKQKNPPLTIIVARPSAVSAMENMDTFFSNLSPVMLPEPKFASSSKIRPRKIVMAGLMAPATVVSNRAGIKTARCFLWVKANIEGNDARRGP